MLWSVLAIVFGVTFAIGSSAGMQSDEHKAWVVSPFAPDHVYPGPTGNYATTPDAESLTYAGTSYVRDGGGGSDETGKTAPTN